MEEKFSCSPPDVSHFLPALMQNESAVGQGAWYLYRTTTLTSLANFTQFIVFIVLFNTVVPISLYVSIEFVKFIQAIFINNDLEMYYEETDTPAIARTSNLNEELGQVSSTPSSFL